MNTEEDEFNRIEREAAMRKPKHDDDDIQDYVRPWQGLTDAEVSKIIDDEIGFNSCWGPEEDFARAIEEALRKKNT